jgi:hypothetical protein
LIVFLSLAVTFFVYKRKISNIGKKIKWKHQEKRG